MDNRNPWNKFSVSLVVYATFMMLMICGLTGAATTAYAHHSDSSGDSRSKSSSAGSDSTTKSSGSSGSSGSSNSGSISSSGGNPSTTGSSSSTTGSGPTNPKSTGPIAPNPNVGPAIPPESITLTPKCSVGYILVDGKCQPSSQPGGNKPIVPAEECDHNIPKCPGYKLQSGHTVDYSYGYGNGIQDGKSGVYDLAAACSGTTGVAYDHCSLGYRSAFVANCIHGKFGCGDGPTTCPPGENCLPPPTMNCPAGSILIKGICKQPRPVNCPIGSIPAGDKCRPECDTGSCVKCVDGLTPTGVKCPQPPQPKPPGKCIDTCPPLCPNGSLVGLECVPNDCHKVDNSTTIICRPHVMEHNTHTTITQLVPGLAANTNDINLFLVTTCTADQNNGVLNGNLAALCDSTITMMHNGGLDAQLPQVDLYLKARGLLQ